MNTVSPSPPATTISGEAVARRLLSENVTIDEIAKELRLRRGTVERLYAAHTTKEQRWTARNWKISLRRSGQSIRGSRWYDWQSVDWTQTDRMIARRLGCCPTAVGARRRTDGRKRSTFHHTPERVVRALGANASARARREQAIVDRIINGDETCESLADQFGVATVTIWKILCRYTTKEQRRAARNRKIGKSRAEYLAGVREAKATQRMIEGFRATKDPVPDEPEPAEPKLLIEMTVEELARIGRRRQLAGGVA